MTDELLDLVDAQDRVIGAMRRSEVYAKDIHNIRVVNGFIVNAKDDLPRLLHPSIRRRRRK
jgi:hypothetical protein